MTTRPTEPSSSVGIRSRQSPCRTGEPFRRFNRAGAASLRRSWACRSCSATRRCRISAAARRIASSSRPERGSARPSATGASELFNVFVRPVRSVQRRGRAGRQGAVIGLGASVAMYRAIPIRAGFRPGDLRESCDPESGVCLGQRHPGQLRRPALGPLVEQDVAAGRVLRDEVLMFAEPGRPPPAL